MNRAISFIIILLALTASGCAFDVMSVDQTSADLASADYTSSSFVLSESAEVTPRGGFKRNLKQGTKWNCIGKIAQGDVCRTKDQVLTVEASHVSEAYIVISSKKLVGFYLPVEHTFVQAENDVPLTIESYAQHTPEQ